MGEDADPLSLNYYLYSDANPVNRIDPNGNDSYIIYDINGIAGTKGKVFKNEADITAGQFVKKYGTRVWTLGVSDASKFMNTWNSKVGFDADGNSVDIDEVRLIFHGSATGTSSKGVVFMYFEGSVSRIAVGNGAIRNSDTDILISDLDSKKMKSLF